MSDSLVHLHEFAGRAGESDEVVIGLVNMMPPAAKSETVRQFSSLLRSRRIRRKIRLRLFNTGTRLSAEDAAALYEPLDALGDGPIDGLIITGTEPRAAAMIDEPNFATLTKLVDWAAEHTASAIFSCFAAHAAVLYIDGIERQPLEQKLSGIFSAAKQSDHTLLAELPPEWLVPHSRHNTLSEAALRRHGYEILSSAERVGVDMFAQSCGKSQFLFFQGHLEYGPDVLLREYSRDVRRFVKGDYNSRPRWPEHHYVLETSANLAALQNELLDGTSEIELLEFRNAMPSHPHKDLNKSWRIAAEIVYANWLSTIAARRHDSASGITA